MDVEEILIRRQGAPHRPSLENRVAYQWADTMDLLGYRTATRRDALVLGALASHLRRCSRPAAVLDIGCAHGNHLLMLAAMLGHDAEVRLEGVDLDPRTVSYATAFARGVPGYANCRFSVADLTEGLPFEDGTFDAVAMSDVIEHLHDVDGALAEISRVTRRGGRFVMCTPLRDSLFKRVAALGNRVTRGRLYRSYYAGKGTELDEHGQPVMHVAEGHEHVSEMTADEIRSVLARNGFRVDREVMLSVMSGSRWFDSHPFVQAGLLALEAVHDRLQRPSWGHAVFVESTRR